MQLRIDLIELGAGSSRSAVQALLDAKIARLCLGAGHEVKMLLYVPDEIGNCAQEMMIARTIKGLCASGCTVRKLNTGRQQRSDDRCGLRFRQSQNSDKT
jgi:hypothetical protein